MGERRPVVWVTEIGEYIRQRSCERRFKLELDRRALARQLPFASRLFAPLDPVLAEMGHRREDAWESALRKAGLLELTGFASRPADDPATPWAEFLERVRAVPPGQTAYGREIGVDAPVGAFHVHGRIDFVLLLWRDGQSVLRLVECKASRRDRTFHRVQVALYRRLVQELLARQASPPLVSERVECVVARIDEGTGAAQDILALEPLDLSMEEGDVERLLAPGGRLHRVALGALEEADYQLDPKCDGCVFNVCCLPESARQRRLELVGLDPSAVRALRAAGVRTIDELAELDLAGAAAGQVRADPGLGASLELLRGQAQARRRTLPGGAGAADGYEVEPLPHAGLGQLPEHEQDGGPLVRVYLAVDHDYSEARVGALSAHVTTSAGQLHTGWIEEAGRFRPDPEVRERVETGRDGEGRALYAEGTVRGAFVSKIKGSEWSGDPQEDSGAERELIQGFLHELVEAIVEVAEAPEAPVHFYVWSRRELTELVEACSRVSSRLLGSLRELLGCRESLEQLIASSLQEEVDRRFALGWTGRGLAVVTSLRWFGRRWHWRRRVAGVEVDLDEVFTQDIFDFQADLELGPDGSWAERPGPGVARHRFEVRSRFTDGLSAPYWRAHWRTLPSPDRPGLSKGVADALRRYERSKKPGLLREYLRARTLALRWVEEGVRFKNPEIRKPPLRLDELPDFTLGVDSTAQAALDFLRLDHHVKVSEWLAEHLEPPVHRVARGRSLPIRQLDALGGRQFVARLHPEPFGLTLAALAARSPFEDGAFVRVSPCSADPHEGQTLRQLTEGAILCTLSSIDWDTGTLFLEAAGQSQESRYALRTRFWNEIGGVFDFATIDDSVTDFVAGHVDERLCSGRGAHVLRWFDPIAPVIPPQRPVPAEALARYEAMLGSLMLGGSPLAEDQAAAALSGLRTRVQLVQGPPGTGKTTTTAVAIVLRILARRRPGEAVLVGAHTHTAVDTLLERIASVLPEMERRALEHGLRLPRVRLAKVHSGERPEEARPDLVELKATACTQELKRILKEAVAVVGGTTAALLKMARSLEGSKSFGGAGAGFTVPLLVVDEASMMVFPHFLALATLLSADGEVLLSGDHRQLAPILAHDWEREDRPPAVLYQPFASAYRAVQTVIENPEVGSESASRAALSFTFRLPPMLRHLIGRVYRSDAIELEGLEREAGAAGEGGADAWALPWQGETGLFLVLHDERRSKRSNELEARIVERLLGAAGPQAPGSVAVVTPHRAQRALLKLRLQAYGPAADVIDTVERLQGNERRAVIVSAAASDPAAIAAEAEFLLDLNRSNVAFSRARDRLIVVCAETLLDHIPVEVEHYEAALLWKALRSLCTRLVATEPMEGHTVRLYAPPSLNRCS
jgi:AAA domain-containing protein/PD-(D/E)XK nuclease superfamily protein